MTNEDPEDVHRSFEEVQRLLRPSLRELVVPAACFLVMFVYLAWFEPALAGAASVAGAALGLATSRLRWFFRLLRVAAMVIGAAGLVGVVTGNLFGAWFYVSLLAIAAAHTADVVRRRR